MKSALSFSSSRLYAFICKRGKTSPVTIFLTPFISLIIDGRIYLEAFDIPPPTTTIPSTILSDSEIVKPATSPSRSKLATAASLSPSLSPSAISNISLGVSSLLSPDNSRYTRFTARILTPSSAISELSSLLADNHTSPPQPLSPLSSSPSITTPPPKPVPRVTASIFLYCFGFPSPASSPFSSGNAPAIASP